MGRVARGFVAVGHPADPMSNYGAVFYDRPFGYGGGLCALRRYRFASAVVDGPLVMDTAHSDPLDVQHVYGLWRDPGPAADGENEDEACARYRDFDHVIEGRDGMAVARSVEVLARAVRDAREGRAAYAVTCVDNVGLGSPTACDGLALLRAADPRDIRYVRPKSGDWEVPSDLAGAVIHIDEVQLAPVAGKSCRKVVTPIYTLTTRQLFGKDAATTLTSVTIERMVTC